MPDILNRLSAVLVGLFALVVAAGSVYVVTSYPPTPEPYEVVAASATPTTAAPTTPAATTSPTAAPSEVLLIGPNVSLLKDPLATATGAAVKLVDAGNPQVIAPGALDSADGTPSVVVLEVRAGSATSVRTTTAITAVRERWSAVRIVVVAPFSSNDRKSAAAVKGAAEQAHVDFLDPVPLGWRTDATSPALSEADVDAVAAKLAAALAQ